MRVLAGERLVLTAVNGHPLLHGKQTPVGGSVIILSGGRTQPRSNGSVLSVPDVIPSGVIRGAIHRANRGCIGAGDTRCHARMNAQGASSDSPTPSRILSRKPAIVAGGVRSSWGPSPIGALRRRSAHSHAAAITVYWLAPCVGNLPNCPGVRNDCPRDERANLIGDRPDGAGRLQDDGVALAQGGAGLRVAAHHRHLVRSQDSFLGSVHDPDHDVLLMKVEGDGAVHRS